MATSAGAIFILRKRTRHLDNTGIYTMKLYPLMPLVFIAAYAFVAVNIFFSTPWLAITALSVFAVMLLLYFTVIVRKKNN